MPRKISNDEFVAIRRKANEGWYEDKGADATVDVQALLNHILSLENDIAKLEHLNDELFKLLRSVAIGRKDD